MPLTQTRNALVALVCLGAAACSVQPSRQPTGTAPPSATSVPSPSPVPPTGTSTATPLPPTATPGCADEQGSILQSELIDPDLPRSLPYRIYIPACVERSFGRLPTLYLLHGLSYTDSQWDDLGADEVAEQLIRLGVAQPFLIVMPWERLGLEYESTIVDYLVPFIEAEYGGSPDRALRAIGGISRGGGWALRIGMGHSDLFGAVGLHSPAVLVPDLFNLAGWIQAGPKPRLWIDIGDRDPLRFSVQDLTEQLDELNAEYQFTQFAGYHEPLYWSLHLEDYMRWYISNWN